jgi:hypothetical protein
MQFLQEYRDRVRHEHGWQVELKCSHCGHTAVPKYKGWTPSSAIHFGDRPTMYANLSCTNCGSDLRKESSEQLVSMFAGVAVPPANRRLIAWFIGMMIGLPLFAVGFVFAGIQIGWWDFRAFRALIVLPLLVAPANLWFNYQVASMRQQCDCGKANYTFMGLLGRSYCYRCASCGNLLRLRD